jgi:hypothetical protein
MKKLIFIFAALMVLLNIFLLYKTSSLRKYHKDILDNIEIFQNNQMNSYKTNFNVSLLNNGLSLEKTILTDSKNHEIKIKDVFHENDKFLICRFSELYCQECVTHSIIKLVNISEKIGKDHIIFLGSYENSKSMNIMKEHLGIQNMAIYNAHNLNIPAEEIGFPYYFMVDKTLKISDIFIPEKSALDLTNKYLEIINERYFKKSSIEIE